jgi:protein-S-isoprenylcysteine O-methyltransferase Ste14
MNVLSRPKILLIVLAIVAAFGAVLFGSAGRLDLPWFWALMAVYTVYMAGMVLRLDPDLARERLRPREPGHDRWFRAILIPIYVAHFVIAGLDVGRFGWSGVVPAWVHALGLAAYTAGLLLAGRAMSVNPFFSSAVRIQRDRGQTLVTDGPYRWVRHPGYSGMLLCLLGSGPALGSLWSMVPLVVVLVLLVRRTVVEDRLLTRELEGYSGYAERVRYRIVPGVW